jgi:hypothetical protein
MEVVLKYVGEPPMELKMTLPEKTQKKKLGHLLKIVEKTYKARHGVPFDDGVQLYRGGTKLDGDGIVGEVLTHGAELVLRSRKILTEHPTAALAVPGKENLAPPKRRRRLVRMNVIADPN